MTTNRADFAAIAHEGGADALALVAEIMEANARSSEWLSNAVEAGMQRQIDEWRTRALVAEARLDRVQDRLDYIIGG